MNDVFLGLSSLRRVAARGVVTILLCAFTAMAGAQQVMVHEQVSFPELIPAGGYSGITWLGDDRYAVVSDNTASDGFFLFRIQTDSLGRIVHASNEGFRGDTPGARDAEGIAWCPTRGTVFVSGEADHKVVELSIDGTPTGKCLQLPAWLVEGMSRKYGLEALTYNAHTHTFWTVSESTLCDDGLQATPQNGVANRLRLMAFDDSLSFVAQYFYEMDAPETEDAADRYAMGVSALAALDDGRILVLEREFNVLPTKIGSTVQCKIYSITPRPDDRLCGNASLKDHKPLQKQLVAEWTTAVGLLDFSIANYEGMCLGPRLHDGCQVVVLIADSQNQYAGILTDWLKTIIIE